MSHPTPNAYANMKQVMRTALVGVSPANQVMLKGYLRVLLRLEVDLEWVAADHPKADLLFINDEFRHAASVRKLLNASTNKAVLFVTKSDSEQGGLFNDTLKLPLTKLVPLNDWLMTNVHVLNGDVSSQESGFDTATTQTEQNLADHARHGSSQKDRVMQDATRSIAARQDQPSNTTAHLQTSAPTTHTAAVASKPKDSSLAPLSVLLVELINLTSQRHDTYHAIVINQKHAAVFNTHTQQVWYQTATLNLSQQWSIKLLSNFDTNEPSSDLFQWLWTVGVENAELFLPLINDTALYQLRYWPKPTNMTIRREVLKVLTALESDGFTLNQMVKAAQVEPIFVKKTLAGLLLAGGLTPAAYTDLDTTMASNINKPKPDGVLRADNVALVNSVANDADTVKRAVDTDLKPDPPRADPDLSVLDTLLAKRASGTSPTSTGSTANSDLKTTSASAPTTVSGKDAQAQRQSQPNDDAKKQKQGFLSKLRKKLGL